MPNSIRIAREWRELSQKNLLAPDIRGINTWPYLPAGLIGINDPISDKEMSRITEELEKETFEIEKIFEGIKERQILIVTWLLAIAIGILGNFLVNLFFGSLTFNTSLFSLFLLFGVSIILGFLTIGVFLYLPINLNYQVRFIPPWKYPSNFFPNLPDDELSMKARLNASYSTSFHRLIVAFSHLISLGILRDELANFDGKKVKVSGIIKITPNHPFYEISFDFKKRIFFWYPNMATEVRRELHQINTILLSAKISIGVYRIDENEERWTRRGVLFLNEVAEWDIAQLHKNIESQMLASDNEKPNLLKQLSSSIQQILKFIRSHTK